MICPNCSADNMEFKLIDSKVETDYFFCRRCRERIEITSDMNLNEA